MSTIDQSEKSLLQTILPKGLTSLAQYILLIFGGLGAIVSLFGDYSEGGDLLSDFFFNRAIYIVSILHLVLVVLVLFSGRLKIDDFYDFRQEYRKQNKNRKSNIKDQKIIFDQSRLFIKYWTYIWMSWGVLYTIFFLDEFWKQNAPYKSTNILASLLTANAQEYDSSIPNQIHDVKLIIDFLMRLANNAGTFFMVLLVVTLFPFKHRNNLLKKIAENFFLLIKKARFVILLIALIGVVDVLLMFGINKLNFVLNISEAGNVLSNIYGVLAATFLAMIAGRLDSYYFDAKPNWAYILFIYAALQASFPFYTADGVSEIKVTVAYAAFTLKGLFYVFVMKQFENWRMYYYLSAYNNKTGWFANRIIKKHL